MGIRQRIDKLEGKITARRGRGMVVAFSKKEVEQKVAEHRKMHLCEPSLVVIFEESWDGEGVLDGE